MKICVAGAAGKMGRRVLELVAQADDLDIGGAIEGPGRTDLDITVGEGNSRHLVTPSSNPAAEMAKADILIDFTIADACLPNIRAAAAAGKPSVIGTTGFSRTQQEEIATLADKVPIVLAPNMSVGVNLLFQLTSAVAATLGLDYNVEITETHHNAKHDSPSGTAVRLAERAAEALDLSYDDDVAHGRQGLIGPRPRAEIGMHALRGGDVVGDHTVSFIGQGERIELTHKAHNRDTFARGALVAARFVKKADPGLYDMQDVLGLK
jgi:4-hydroxy-tetrahydrodipicolinate reductase